MRKLCSSRRFNSCTLAPEDPFSKYLIWNKPCFAANHQYRSEKNIFWNPGCSNLVPTAFPSQNGGGHFLREKPWGRGWVIELTEKFLFDNVRLSKANQSNNNPTDWVRLSSIGYWFGFVRLTSPGILDNIAVRKWDRARMSYFRDWIATVHKRSISQ